MSQLNGDKVQAIREMLDKIDELMTKIRRVLGTIQ